MVQAIVFDCFGVLTSDGLMPFLHKHFGLDAVRMQQAQDLGKRVDAGFGDYDEFIVGIANMAHVPESVAREQVESNVPNEDLFKYIKSVLKPVYKIGLLSNAGRNWLDTLFNEQQLALFDAVVLSYEAGFVKPDERAYHEIARRLGVETSACVLVDDLARYVAGAQDAGMYGIQYVTVQQLRQDLSNILKRE